MMDLFIIVVTLGLILLSAELFTNSVEWLGWRLNLSQGAVGSVLAAIGTALPETIIPIIALIFGKGTHGKEIGVGAILGAPFMLGTLAFLITGFSVIYYARRAKRPSHISVNRAVIKRDLLFFICIYTLAIAAAFVSARGGKLVIAAALVAGYVVYLYLTFRDEPDQPTDAAPKPLFLARAHPEPHILRISFQVILALGLMVFSAHHFVTALGHFALKLNVSPFILSVIITPIATELPEKFNSVLWMSQGKDTLALGNITGAMVFQSSIIPAIGILLTPWSLKSEEMLTALIALFSASLVYAALRFRETLNAGILMSGGLLYLIYLLVVTSGLTAQ